MRISLKNILKTALIAAPLTFMAVSCGEGDGDGDAAADDGFGTANQNVSMTGTLNFTTATALVADTYKLYCVTFEDTPSSSSVEVVSGEEFTIDVWTGVNFGCFLVNSTSGETLATLTVLDVGTGGLGDGDKTSMQITADIDLGPIPVENGVAAVTLPSTELEKFANGTPSLNPENLHEKTYNVACNNTTAVPTEAKEKCATSFDGSDNIDVYFRLLKATDNGESIYGLGVWQSATAFSTTCGGFDFATAKFNEIEGSGITFEDSVTYGTYPEGCELDDDGSAKANMAVGPLNKSGIGYTFKSDEKWEDSNSGCTVEKTINIEFTGTATKLAGLFNENVFATGEACDESQLSGNSTPGTYSYPVIFTPK